MRCPALTSALISAFEAVQRGLYSRDGKLDRTVCFFQGEIATVHAHSDVVAAFRRRMSSRGIITGEVDPGESCLSQASAGGPIRRGNPGDDERPFVARRRIGEPTAVRVVAGARARPRVRGGRNQSAGARFSVLAFQVARRSSRSRWGLRQRPPDRRPSAGREKTNLLHGDSEKMRVSRIKSTASSV